MKTNALFIAFIILFFTPILSHAQTKRALIIGLGKQEDPAWNKINGDKDVSYVLKMLNAANYKQIITCVNEEATKAGIISAFETLTQSCQQNDIVYIHFSGHGQQIRDCSKDEEDALDECWIPYDAYRKWNDTYNGEKHLVDDEVNVLLTNIRDRIGDKGKMLVVIDACHSGSATRGPKEVVRGVSDVFVVQNTSGTSSPSTPTADICPNEERWITLSACKSNQVNTEMKNPVVGKLTYAIFTKVNNRELGTNDEFIKSVRVFMNMNKSSRAQKAEMTGEITKYNIADILR